MRLFEAIVEANHRAVGGDREVSLPLEQFADALPVVALSCIDVRLNRYLPHVLGVPEEHFIWLRNAGNIITGTTSSTMRSLSLACAIKGGREIAIIGHTDCRAGQTSVGQLIEAFQRLGVGRAQLPENLLTFYGLFASERQNVMSAVEFVRASPLIGPRVPVHGLMLDLANGQVNWVVNGYDNLDSIAGKLGNVLREAGSLKEAIGELGEAVSGALSSVSARIGEAPAAPPAAESATAAPAPPSPTTVKPPPLAAPKPPAVRPPPISRLLQPWRRKT